MGLPRKKYKIVIWIFICIALVLVSISIWLIFHAAVIALNYGDRAYYHARFKNHSCIELVYFLFTPESQGDYNDTVTYVCMSDRDTRRIVLDELGKQLASYDANVRYRAASVIRDICNELNIQSGIVIEGRINDGLGDIPSSVIRIRLDNSISYDVHMSSVQWIKIREQVKKWWIENRIRITPQ